MLRTRLKLNARTRIHLAPSLEDAAILNLESIDLNIADKLP